MARSSRKSSSAKSGSTLFGILIGLIVGLAAAVAVALFVTKVPMPFVDKASRDPAKTLLPDVRDAPDPNIGLYGSGAPAGSAAGGSPVTPPAPLPDIPPVASSPGAVAPGQDSIGNLIASLSDPPATAPSKPPAAPGTGAKPVVPGTEAPPPARSKPAAGTQTTYYLQAGAFRSEADAEAMKARILMLGLPVQLQKAQVNGGTIHRVRVGPFKGIDEMNRSRERLGSEKIESSVVRP
ncbi:SPOR domain-containing protein [Parapusillimonas granuli]|uniref:SPOR domain-containing protein n=1 Tax=Parapusillimonas granuli TaxID=380911 RepID=A0A853FU21_9BURK|nr:SPOR domain-containing protein [Parapusillimonas granuli]MBB5216496.1 cell division protein FtsN [Parapusillimonas granuli]MEB2399761.1 SPOR domain-containing protein [Alcaligenaceae bacterium]NYT48198.1 SPOR domain-containing protein [Parapusillimonas granuli]